MKGEPLRHDFGSGEVSSYRWINADGSASGIVAESATVADSAFIGPDAIIGAYARICYRASISAGASICDGSSIGDEAAIGDGARIGDGASIGDGAVIEAADWHMAGACGSRKAVWTAVHSREHGLRWWVGCQRGISTDALLAAVQETHGDNEHAQAYRHAVQCVTTHPEYLKRTQEGQSE